MLHHTLNGRWYFCVLLVLLGFSHCWVINCFCLFFIYFSNSCLCQRTWCFFCKTGENGIHNLGSPVADNAKPYCNTIEIHQAVWIISNNEIFSPFLKSLMVWSTILQSSIIRRKLTSFLQYYLTLIWLLWIDLEEYW